MGLPNQLIFGIAKANGCLGLLRQWTFLCSELAEIQWIDEHWCNFLLQICILPFWLKQFSVARKRLRAVVKKLLEFVGENDCLGLQGQWIIGVAKAIVYGYCKSSWVLGSMTPMAVRDWGIQKKWIVGIAKEIVCWNYQINWMLGSPPNIIIPSLLLWAEVNLFWSHFEQFSLTDTFFSLSWHVFGNNMYTIFLNVWKKHNNSDVYDTFGDSIFC